MRISALITELSKLHAQHGDLEVCIDDADTRWTLQLTEPPRYYKRQNCALLYADYGYSTDEVFE